MLEEVLALVFAVSELAPLTLGLFLSIAILNRMFMLFLSFWESDMLRL